MKYLLFTALGMFLMYIVLRIMSARTVSTGADTTRQLKNLVTTPQFNNLLKTNEAREVIKTPEFRNFLGTLASDQITSISRSLITYETK